MDHYEAIVAENRALKADVARLEEENKSLQEQCRMIHKHWESQCRRTKIGVDANNYLKDKLTEEIMRQGGSTPWKPQPQCETALSALNLVRNWDRDVYLEGAMKQRAELLKRIDALKTGRELQMDDVIAAMDKDAKVTFFEKGTLFDVLYDLRKQIKIIYEGTWPHLLHEEWFFAPLCDFRTYVDGVFDVDAESMDEDA